MRDRDERSLEEIMRASLARWETGGVFDRNEEWLKRDRERSAAEAKRSWLRDMEMRGVPREHRERLADGLIDTACLREVRAWLVSSETLMVLAGGRGCGKTQAAAHCVAERGLFVVAGRLARLDRYESEVVEPLENCAVLVIDDLGAEYLDRKGFYLSFLDELVDRRHSNRRKTMLTTNATWDEFKRRYGERIADRARVGTVYEEIGPSLRRKENAQ